ncbi:MAG TPA: beta-ketoacyl-[acyl-carrier-protein] synthase family protein [Methylomirabilota bacterium]|nr:beta-ketoacyl-[acyl-carrier-protein] synthase family protein [Methylomirabilota bacterium]
MNGRRVVITGLGVVAPNGIGKEEFWENLIGGKSAVDYITAFDPTPFPCKVAAEVKNFKPTDFVSSRSAKMMGRFSQFAVAAAKLAVADSDIGLNGGLAEETSVCFGNSVNGAGDIYEYTHLDFLSKGFQAIPSWTTDEYTPHAAASHVAIEFGIKGQVMTLSSACSTGVDVVQWGYDKIFSGQSKVVIAGSSEAPIFPYAFAGLCSRGVLTKWDGHPAQASRPYDLKRDGFVLGEGGGCVVLEDLEHALDRGAHIYAEVLGSASANESGHMRKVDLNGTALCQAIDLAIHKAGLSREDIDYINAHGNAMPDYDVAETTAFKQVFGDRIYHIPVSSIKSMIGQSLAASPMFQVVSSSLAIHESIIPPTINYEYPDPHCDLDYVPNESRSSRIRNILINAHGMGGTHSVLILGRPEFSSKVTAQWI